MKRNIFILAVLLSGLVVSAAGQKGIDTQTQKIKDTSNKVISKENDATRSFDWGKGKTNVRERLANPYRMASRRDILVETIKQVIKDQKMLVDEAASRPGDGILVTQPFIFTKGAVIAQGELSRYAVLDGFDRTWSRGRYVLIIEVQSIDGVQNNVSVNARVEGREGAGLLTEWRTVQSSGLAEDEFLKVLVETVTGVSLDPLQDVEKVNN
jgi:hypothetical protein